MNALTHEEAAALLHEAASHLDTQQHATLAAHLGECDQCRAYADQLSALQPLLTRALRTRHYAHVSEQSEAAQAILQRKRRSVMRKRLTAILGIATAAVIAIIAMFSMRIPTQSMTGAQRVATTTPTLMPSPTPTILSTSTPLSSLLLSKGADRFEPNDNFDQATPIALNTKYDRLNFAMLTPSADSWDSDYFKVRVKPGMLITCRTLDLSPGTDTNLILYDNNQNGIAGQDDVDRVKGDLSSSLTYSVTYEGWLYVLVGEGFTRPPTEAQQATYSFECVTPGATTTPGASGSTPLGVDRFEPNDDFDHATAIDLNVKYDQLSFAMLNPNSTNWDNDFFKIRVKPDMLITCRTSDLSGGADTNLILYDNNQNGIYGNDDVDRAKGDLSSSVTYTVTYEGWLYILVGEGFSRTPAEAQQATYSFECSTGK